MQLLRKETKVPHSCSKVLVPVASRLPLGDQQAAKEKSSWPWILATYAPELESSSRAAGSSPATRNSDFERGGQWRN